MNKISSQTIYRGAFGLAVAIMFGAFGAHYLKEKLPVENLQIFETAVKYQFYGCLGLLALGIMSHTTEVKLNTPIFLLRLGVLIFCGTVYFLALRPVFGIDGYKCVGAITPIGGLCMMACWIWVGVLFYFIKKPSS